MTDQFLDDLRRSGPSTFGWESHQPDRARPISGHCWPNWPQDAAWPSPRSTSSVAAHGASATRRGQGGTGSPYDRASTRPLRRATLRTRTSDAGGCGQVARRSSQMRPMLSITGPNAHQRSDQTSRYRATTGGSIGGIVICRLGEWPTAVCSTCGRECRIDTVTTVALDRSPWNCQEYVSTIIVLIQS